MAGAMSPGALLEAVVEILNKHRMDLPEERIESCNGTDTTYAKTNCRSI